MKMWIDGGALFCLLLGVAIIIYSRLCIGFGHKPQCLAMRYEGHGCSSYCQLEYGHAQPHVSTTGTKWIDLAWDDEAQHASEIEKGLRKA